jgi:hypothetical protein
MIVGKHRLVARAEDRNLSPPHRVQDTLTGKDAMIIAGPGVVNLLIHRVLILPLQESTPLNY